MPVEHDLLHRVDSLQQALCSDKMPIAIFLGAGCPTAIRDEEGNPLVPAMDGLTKSCLTYLERKCGTALKCLTGKLRADGEEQPNIERLLSEIRGLLQVIGNGEICGLRRKSLQELEREVCEHVAETMDRELPRDDTPYHRLGAWIGAIERTHPVEVFTPNYDLLLEQALEDSRVPYFDGFSGSRRAFFDAHAVENDELPSRWARLWKLHGSLNWFMSNGGNGGNGGAVYRSTDGGNYSCRLIHPSHLKYDESRKMPYFALLERMRRFLLRPNSLMVVCGYSFRDEHLNACICDALQANPGGSTVFGLLYGGLAGYPAAVALAGSVSNLVLLARDRGVIGRAEGPWLEESPDDADTWHGLVEWEEHAPALQLGDFSVFGTFLSDVVGAPQ
jgi:hypothetical protein